jgi:ribosome-binding factor A
MGVRQERVQEQLVHELSEIIHRDLRDPRLGFVTLTGAEITRDLRYAKIYVSVMGDEEARKQCLKALQSATGLLRGEFARRAHLRMAPELEFRFDYGIERGQRIFELLHSVEGDLKPTEEPAPRPDGSPVAAEQETHGQA